MGALSYDITVGDYVYASIVAGGRTIASLAGDGFANIEQVARQLHTTGGRFLGLGSLNIRNKTRGWRLERPLATAPRRAVPAAS